MNMFNGLMDSLQERRVHQQLFKVSDMFCDFFKHSSEPSLTE